MTTCILANESDSSCTRMHAPELYVEITAHAFSTYVEALQGYFLKILAIIIDNKHMLHI